MTQLNLSSSFGGLNLSDPLDNMQPHYAIQMDNIIPEPTGDVVRSGYVKRSNGNYDVVLPISTQSNPRIVCADEEKLYVYDPENFDNAPTEKGGFSSEKWMNCLFTDGSGKVHCFFANGQDVVQDYYDGSFHDTTFTTTGLTKLDSPLSFKNRMYFIADDFKLVYGGVQSISGALTEFAVGSYFKKGGKILAISNWTQDSGQGVDDLFVILSTEGEVMIYSGTSPESDDWNTLGVFQIPRPIGKRCVEMVGADLVVITERGYMPLSSVLSDLRANRTAISGKINPIVEGKNLSLDWEIHFYSKKGWLFVNAPSTVPGYAHEQHVLNMDTNGWCRFLGMDAQSWCVLFDRLFFVNAKGLFEANIGNTDNGDWIKFQIQKAYNTFGTEQRKQIMREVPRYSSFADNTIYKRINVDFKEGKNREIITQSDLGYASYWDTSIWDESFWSDEYTSYQTRAGVTSRTGSFISIGYYGRTKMQLSLYSTGIVLKIGTGHI